MAEEKEVLLEVKDLNVTYGSGRKAFAAVQNANFQIYKGETFGLVGESGSGKTTIGRAILRILPTSGGEILYKGQKINGKIPRALDKQITREIQMIFQDPQSSLNERAKVSYIVGEGLQNVRPDLSTAQQEEKVRQALLDVGLLPEFASRFPHEFSGGQRQRIGIARALIVEPEFIVADEPISALDMSIRAQVLNLLRRLQKERGITYLFIAHDLSVMRYISDRIAVIHKGSIVELADAEELVAHAIHPYTRSLLSAIPMPDPRRERNKKLLVYDPAMHDLISHSLFIDIPTAVHYNNGGPFWPFACQKVSGRTCFFCRFWENERRRKKKGPESYDDYTTRTRLRIRRKTLAQIL